MASPTDFNQNSFESSNDFAQSQKHRVRVGGSTFTVFTWQDQAIAFARQITHQSPAPVGPGTTPIHPLDAPYPVQLVTPQALTMGTLVLELYELYGNNVWNNIGIGSAGDGIVDLANIFAEIAAKDKPVHVVRVIRPPRIRGQRLVAYTEEFHNCVVSSLDDGETIEIGTMEVLKRLTVNYTHVTRGGKNGLLGATGVQGIAPPGIASWK